MREEAQVQAFEALKTATITDTDTAEARISAPYSVLMSVYAGEKAANLSIALESMLTQTLKPCEIVLVKDGPLTQELEDVIAQKTQAYPGIIKPLALEKNVGLGEALARGLNACACEYVARMDSDDISLPYRFEKEVDYLETHEDCVLVSSAVFEINENGDEIRRTLPCSEDRILKAILKTPDSMIVHPMVLMRRDAYEKAGGYLPIRKSQDVLFWSRIAKQGEFRNLSIPLGKYRILSSSLDHSNNPYKPVLTGLLRKMVLDDIILDSDINLYNNIFNYSKSFMRQTEVSKKKSINVEDLVFRFLSFIIGDNLAASFIIALKNNYYSFKLR